MLKIPVMAVASIIIGTLAFHYNLKFSYADFKDYCTALLALSGMVFTIMGIWIAFIYPNAIKRLQDPDKIKIADFTSTMEDTRRLESIVGSVMESGFVAAGVTGLFLLKLLVTGLPFYTDSMLIFKSAAIGIVIFLTLIQGSSVFSVIYANYLFIGDLHTRRETQERNNDF
ncbi:hypothetical protein [Pseudomonas sp. NPDC086278]|uniref:hypothetical protein n=1 Tax=Pseudomonas sp. NPDC086278 TaxID=3390646 RepID=UPI003CFF29A8